MRKNNKTVVVAMSGGLDSSMAVKVLQKQGYRVIGMYMYLGFQDDKAREAVENVSKSLGIDFKVVDISQAFKKEVIDYFVESYRAGLTPNPCVKCNKVIKFGELLKQAESLGADYLATGHYLQKKYHKNNLINIYYKFLNKVFKVKFDQKLFTSKDNLKDQTYFLYNFNQKKLRKIIFPVGKFKKTTLRKKANKLKLPYLKSESQDICFLSGDHNIFLRQHLPNNPGEIRNLKGETIGKHQGLYFYTIGQRRGIDIGGSGPYYVVRLDFENNILYVADKWDHHLLYKKTLEAREVNWLASKKPNYPLHCQAVIRYGHRAVNCRVLVDEENKGKVDKVKVEFEKEQRAITPGQSIVFYKNQELLGGGIIE
ncbi:MAG: tRNA 2-thiouridine(34) synthase MnmA [Candidatus Pacebacteria bacterium]|nr:tRNA 2-thiouridine(34) synthase MnmA [Candidatus Paceibacterota bacterium]